MTRFAALREVLVTRDFRRLYSVRLVGQFADGLVQASLATFVLFSPERQPSAVKVATAFAILLLPYSIIGPFAGVLLDRWRRRNVLVYANFIKALGVVPIVALIAAGNDGALLGIAVLAVLGVGRFVLAGLSASLPHVVQGRDLVTANALSPTSGTIAAAVGAGAGVALRSLVGGGDTGSQFILMLAAVGFVLAGLIAWRIAAAALGPSGERVPDSIIGVILGFVDGLRALARHARPRRAITVVGVHRIALGMLTVDALLLVRNTLNATADADRALTQFAIITAAAASGALVGAVATPWCSRRLGTVTWSSITLIAGGALGGALVLAGAMSVSMPLLLGGAACFGLIGQSVKVCADTEIQLGIADDHLGRVFALFDMIVNAALVLGITLMAASAPASGQAPAMICAAGVLLVVTGAWFFTTRHAKGT
ncbi:MAG: MFS transporter [Candidatus Nanopelagicales bacterium]|nr:MFS transporter [Candidatus Nanopelagicales bacterium]